MEAIVEWAAGLEIHQSRIVACILIGQPGRKPTQQTRSFGTMAADLDRLRAWLVENAVTHVGLESTGVYWCFLHELLDGPFTVPVGNPNHIRSVPGRKTDIKDAEWITDLVRHGLLKPSFVPPPAMRERRALVRFRHVLAGQLSLERNRVPTLLEGANIESASVVPDVFGVSGRAMQPWPTGTPRPPRWPSLPRGGWGANWGHWPSPWTGVSRTRTGICSACIGAGWKRSIATSPRSRPVSNRPSPLPGERDRLVQIPGVDVLGAVGTLAENGTDMGQFGTARLPGQPREHRPAEATRHAQG
jgi:Transposase and inactivated derivatives